MEYHSSGGAIHICFVIFEKGSLTHQVSRLARKLQVPTCLCSPALRLQARATMPVFLMWVLSIKLRPTNWAVPPGLLSCWFPVATGRSTIPVCWPDVTKRHKTPLRVLVTSFVAPMGFREMKGYSFSFSSLEPFAHCVCFCLLVLPLCTGWTPCMHAE